MAKKPTEINPNVKAAHQWYVYKIYGGGATLTVNADLLTVTADGALAFFSNVGGANQVVLAVGAGQYAYAQLFR